MMIDQATLISADAANAGAAAIAAAFGLGDTTLPSNDWPVDDGDSVLCVELTGAFEGQLWLAVNNDVAGRLSSDTSRLRDGFARALAAMLDAVGADPEAGLELGELGTIEGRPDTSVEIYDGKQMCALFGVVVQAAADDEAAGAAGDGGETTDPGMVGGPAPYEPASFAGAGGMVANGAAGPLSLLQDVEMNVTVELGRTTMPIRELLALQPGMVVEIDRQAGAPIDVLVNGRLIACGEVVVIDEEFGIRITEIVDAGARL